MATRLTSNQKIMGSTPIVSAFFFGSFYSEVNGKLKLQLMIQLIIVFRISGLLYFI